MLIQHLKALKRGYLQISSHTKVINTEISFHKQTNNKIILDLKDKENIKYNNFSESTKLHVFKKVERWKVGPQNQGESLFIYTGL